MHFFFYPFISETLIQFEEDESMHLKVLRANEGDEILVINGKGDVAKAIIQSIAKRFFTAQIILIERHIRRNTGFHLAVAPLKQMDRIEWMLEKVCELGIEQISFIETKRTERDKLNFERLNKIVHAACKQSKNFWFPEMPAVIERFDTFLNAHEAHTNLIAYCGGEFSGIEQKLRADSSTLILIGPEGDFTDEEFNLATQHGFKGISLGNTRLRTETAAIYATAAFKFVNAY